MRILNVITTIELGGAEKQLLIQSRLMVAAGHKITILPLKGKLELLTSFQESGVDVNLTLHDSPFFKQVFKLSWTLLREKSVILHAHLPRAEILCWLASRFHKVSLIVTRHNSETFIPFFFLRNFSGYISRIILRSANTVIAISNAVKTFLQMSKEVECFQSVEVVHYCYDPLIAIETVEDYADAKPFSKFVTVARLEEQKNLDVLIQAFAMFRGCFGYGCLDVYGSGALRNELELLARNLGVEDSVRFKGKVKNPSSLLQQYDCVFLTSKYEGFGLVLLEAMQKGLPVLCSNAEAIVEVMGDGYQGFFEIGSATSLFSLMSKLRNPKAYNDLASYCSNRINDFSPSRTLSRLIEIYELALDTND